MMIVLLSIDDYKIWIKNGDFNKPIYKIEYNSTFINALYNMIIKNI